MATSFNQNESNNKAAQEKLGKLNRWPSGRIDLICGLYFTNLFTFNPSEFSVICLIQKYF